MEELYGEIKRLIDNLIKALEQDKFNEHWKVAANLKSKIQKEFDYVEYHLPKGRE